MKSIEVKFNEVCASLTEAGRFEEFQEKVSSGMPIETRLNIAEAVLKDSPAKRLETLREAQYNAYLASGMNEAQARAAANLCGERR